VWLLSDTSTNKNSTMKDGAIENTVSFAALGSTVMNLSEVLTLVLLVTAIALNVKKLIKKD